MSKSVTTEQRQFTALMRFFHGLTAAIVLTMLGIGAAMMDHPPTTIVWFQFIGRWVFSYGLSW